MAAAARDPNFANVYRYLGTLLLTQKSPSRRARPDPSFLGHFRSPLAAPRCNYRKKRNRRENMTMDKRHRRSYEREVEQPIAITPVEYSGLQEAYDHFNGTLFDGKLVDVFITYQRHAHSRGHFAPDRFSGRTAVGGRHELALNPDHFVGRSDEEITSTLVHEMVHVWQQQHGKPASRGYHNKQWAVKMKEVGLQPSNTGGAGGKETGQQMSHYVIPGGCFAGAFAELAAMGWRLNLESAHRAGPDGGRKSKTKFTCFGCGQNAWGKPDLAVTCTPCGIEMRLVD